jgi:hypothetical protein
MIVSRTPAFRRRQMSWTLRQRLMRLLTGQCARADERCADSPPSGPAGAAVLVASELA